MSIFVRLVSFTSEGRRDMKSFREGRADFLSALKKLEIKLVGEYVTTGQVRSSYYSRRTGPKFGSTTRRNYRRQRTDQI